jgi:6-pyruvoyltetrahydropterin/6-carboxytetrahydropterin synthase
MKRIYKTTFDAAHFIKGHPKCGKLHGHTYHLTVKIPDKTGNFKDFIEIKEIIDRVLEEFDHNNLGNETCEELAIEIKTKIQQHFIETIEVELMETEHFGVEL